MLSRKFDTRNKFNIMIYMYVFRTSNLRACIDHLVDDFHNSLLDCHDHTLSTLVSSGSATARQTIKVCSRLEVRMVRALSGLITLLFIEALDVKVDFVWKA